MMACGIAGLFVGYVVVKFPGSKLSGYLRQVSFLPYLVPSIGFAAACLSLFAVARGPIPSIYGTLFLVVLVMSVNPGFSGQVFLPEVLPKITQVRQWLGEVNPAALSVRGEPTWVTTGSRLWANPDPTPDGEWVVFYSRDQPEGDVYVSRPDGTGLRQLTSDAAIDRVPRWSP